MTDTATEKRDLPEVKEFVEAWNAIDTEISDLYRKKTELYRTADRETYEAACVAHRTARDAKFEKRDALIVTLMEKTEDKLVTFILKNYLDDYTSQAFTVLEALPATIEKLDEIAEERGWCSVWMDAVMEAVEAGAIEMDKVQRLRRQLHRRMANEMGDYDARQAMKLVDEIIEMSVERDRAERIEKALNLPEGVDDRVENLAKTAKIVVDALSQ